MMSERDIYKYPNCQRRGDETPLHACGNIVYRCVECDIYFYFCQQQKRKIDIGAIDTYFYRKGKSPQVRSRAKFILLLDQGFSISQLIKIFGVSRKTIYNWLTRWEEQGVLGLYNQKGRGRKPKLTSWQKETVKEWVKQEPKSLNKVVAKVDKEWSIDQASIHTSDSLIEKLEEWERKNLKIFWLPTYSPKHNLIEILWKFIKYEWIEINAYSGWTSLHNYLKKVLDNFGTEYVINFV